MGKGGGSSQPQTQVVQPSLPQLPNQDQINSQAQNRLYASQPWMNSPWRAIDFFPQQTPTLFMPQFQPPAPADGNWGSVYYPAGMGSAPQGGAPGGGGGFPGFNFPMGPMPGTALGQQALSQNVQPSLLGMLGMLAQGMGGQQQAPPQQSAAPQQQAQAKKPSSGGDK